MESGRGGKRAGAGRPAGTDRGKSERITISISAEHLQWLKAQELSYGKTIARLIEAERNI